MKRKYVYSVSHFKEYGEDLEQRKTLGIFGSRQKAKEALERYKQLPGFKEDNKEELFIARKVLGLSFWDGGYISMEDFAASAGIKVVYEEEEDTQEIIIDLPYWFRKHQHRSETSSNMSHIKSFLAERYHTDEYPRGPQSEFFQTRRFLELG